MTNRQLLDIIQDIQQAEGVDLTTIAAKCDIDRSYLSKFINHKATKNVTPQLLRKLERGYGGYFSLSEENNKNNGIADSVYRSEYIKLLKEDRTLLADVIKLNLNIALETLRTVAARQEADEEVILYSLARLERLPESKLYLEAGKRKSQIEKAARKLDKSGVPSK